MLALVPAQSSAIDTSIEVVADIMPRDVQIVLRVLPVDRPVPDESALGGLELWVSVPQC
jgi:hypothetical protein